MNYRGRFAPSPTGPLHAGSLLTALGSYIDARAHRGTWVVRIEDLDPPRVQPGAERQILDALEAHKLCWDGPLLRQSERLEIYQESLESLLANGQAYRCDCSRSDLKARGALQHYDRHCLNQRPDRNKPTAIRALGGISPGFIDRIQGKQPAREVGDFIVYRRDGLFAYQLAVVVDDQLQGINQIVRGKDLLDETEKQILLQQSLEFRPISYAHLPLILASDGQKLSKQTFATPISSKEDRVREQLIDALAKLGQKPPNSLIYNNSEEIIDWSIAHWAPAKVPNDLSI